MKRYSRRVDIQWGKHERGEKIKCAEEGECKLRGGNEKNRGKKWGNAGRDDKRKGWIHLTQKRREKVKYKNNKENLNLAFLALY